MSLPVGAVLIAASTDVGARRASAVFAVSLSLMFGTSAGYHRLANTTRSRDRWRRLDHAAIFIGMAGTATPIFLLSMPPPWAVPLLAALWFVALVGVVAKVTSFHSVGRLTSMLYAMSAASVLIVVPFMIVDGRILALSLFLAGGAAYVGGASVLIRNVPNPWPATFGYHEVWHTFTLIAAACHVVMVVALI